MRRELSGEGQVVEPGDVEHGLVNAVALEAAVPEDLPYDPVEAPSVVQPLPASQGRGQQRTDL